SSKVLVSFNNGPFGQKATSTPALPPHLPETRVCDQSACVSSVLDVHSREAGGPDYRVHVWSLTTTDGRIDQLVVALPLADVSATLGQLLFIEVLVWLGVLAVAGAAGLYLVRLGLRPLTEIEATAGAIAGGDLTQRVRRADQGTEVGRLGIALNSMLGQIESAFAEKDASEQRLRRFLADASHELRTPLTSIRGYAELFRRGASSRPDDLAKVMARIEEESARMGILVDDLLLLARLDQGRPLEHEPVDLTALVAEGVEAARAVEPDRPIEAMLDETLTVRGDALRLRQVIDNLLANIRTHTPRLTSARVVLTRSAQDAVLEVIDRGPGLPDDGRERIFNRFFRADPSRSRDRGGAGLGLAIVHAIVTAHGGTIAALNTVPTGTTFRITLPIKGSEPEEIASQ
ncbi:MAG TPA: HAMP domain-containing sensor histidine kinase, partial [Candidatus Dormibacteraeota bacterium]|nr:HAMP domain-containing sensor histidine kinase [Candidatus Dormibacteraeota bacterium]